MELGHQHPRWRLGIAALILGSGPLGWAAAAVGAIGWLISWFFDDREEKARRAREKLTKRLLATSTRWSETFARASATGSIKNYSASKSTCSG